MNLNDVVFHTSKNATLKVYTHTVVSNFELRLTETFLELDMTNRLVEILLSGLPRIKTEIMFVLLPVISRLVSPLFASLDVVDGVGLFNFSFVYICYVNSVEASVLYLFETNRRIRIV